MQRWVYFPHGKLSSGSEVDPSRNAILSIGIVPTPLIDLTSKEVRRPYPNGWPGLSS